MEIKTIGVVGSGIMGTGIAQTVAQAGLNVILRDIEEHYLEASLSKIGKTLSRSVEKGRLSEQEKVAILGRIKPTVNMKDMKAADYVVEAATETPEVKKTIFRELDEITRRDVILSTNTSSMSITKMGAATKRPDKVVGMHFMNPVPIMKLVEIIRGVQTSDETIAICKDLSEKLGKEYVEVKIDKPGFVATSLIHALFMEAITLYERGVASIEDIDKTCRLAFNHPMGPFRLNDMGGLDLALHVQQYFSDELPKEERYGVPVILRNMVTAGLLGEKTGKGWYDYSK
jgi:3-hydroxybutyryl-CoA dehydrogenase